VALGTESSGLENNLRKTGATVSVEILYKLAVRETAQLPVYC